MRYEMTDNEWAAMRPMLPNRPRVPRVNDRRVLNGIFWVLRSGAPWPRPAKQLRSVHDLLQSFSFVGDARASGPR
jgi:transposase